ncbi:MAG: LTA synthase family protein [Lentimicrobiaceae bacterium]|nr:LTA synthase family protein [Lentimicrobiaceae bacterium]
MRTVKILKPYLISVILFLLLGYIFKTVETLSFCNTQESTSFLTLLQAYLNITAIFCLYSLIILPFYLLFAFLHRKTAQIVTAILFALLFSLEAGLYVYYTQAGVLMGRELVIRPISETWVTIRNSSDIVRNAVLIVMVFAYFIALPFLFKKVKIFNHYRSLMVGFFIIGIFAICALFFYQKTNHQIANNYLASKSFFFFSALKSHSIEEMEPNYLVFDKEGNFEIEKNENILKEYVALYNETAEDFNYPMERVSSEIPNVLSPYFKKSGKNPNIVIIIVESLGTPFMGEKGENHSFTPYLDYLANTGLYWKNCLSTTMRTYGVIPSVTGSVPHGIKGFQFGMMPKHHSLFSILKNNNYTTNFFYGGDTNFDNILDFITAQDVDHVDNYLPQLRALIKEKQANGWGIHDEVLFGKSINYLKTLPKDKPKLNVYLTLSTHDKFNSREDKELKTVYDPKAEEIFSKLNEEQQKYFLPVKNILSGFVYADDCIRGFIHNYAKRPDFENTIFIITGDHSFGSFESNLQYHVVPLIIWSPLLKNHQAFPNIVSHLAIVPSIVSLLQNHYHVKVPDKLAWCSAGLDTASVFNPAEKVLFLSYDRMVNKMVYNQYFFEDKTKWYNKRLFEINENLDFKQVDDPNLMEQIYSKFKTLKYVNNYVYHNDKLIKSDHNAGERYKLIKVYENKDTIVCTTPDTIPSISGISEFDILPVQKIKGKYNKIKIRLKTDIVINDFMWQDHQMMLNFICSGDKLDYVSRDHIVKYILEDDILCDKKYELSVEKEIDVRDLNESYVRICVTSNLWDENWQPDKKITLSNIKVTIWGK